MEFVIDLNRRSPLSLTGLFFPEIDYRAGKYYANPEGVLLPVMEKDPDLPGQQRNVARFEELCTAHGIAFSIHRDFNHTTLEALAKETRFADLLLLGNGFFHEGPGDKLGNQYLASVLHEAECPVLIVPRRFDFHGTLVLAYDGSASSVYALKQFAYLLPALAGNKATVVHASDDKSGELPDEAHIRALAEGYFSNLSFLKLNVGPRKNFEGWLREQQATLLVTGSQGRSLISELFRKSFAQDVIDSHSLSVFVAHK